MNSMIPAATHATAAHQRSMMAGRHALRRNALHSKQGQQPCVAPRQQPDPFSGVCGCCARGCPADAAWQLPLSAALPASTMYCQQYMWPRDPGSCRLSRPSGRSAYTIAT